MKEDLVRIGAERAKKLNDVANQMLGCNANSLVRTAVDFLLMVIGPAQIAALVDGCSFEEVLQRIANLWVEVEGPVYLAAFEEARAKLKERQAIA